MPDTKPPSALPPLPADSAAVLDSIRRAHRPHIPVTPKTDKPLIVLDPGHGKYVYDGIMHLYNSEEFIDSDGDRGTYPGEWRKLEKNVDNPVHYLDKHGRDRVYNGKWDGKTYVDSHGHKHNHPNAKLKAGTIIDDFGTVMNGIHEADINLATAKKLKAKLEARGFAVELVRDTKDDIVESRFDARSATGADKAVLHLAIHCDYYVNNDATDLVAYYSEPKDGHPRATQASIDFADAIAGGKGLSKGHKTDLLISHHFDTIPASLVEIGNVRNPQELAWISSDKGQDAIADELAGRIAAHYKTMPKKINPAPALPQLDNDFLHYPFGTTPKAPTTPLILIDKGYIINRK